MGWNGKVWSINGYHKRLEEVTENVERERERQRDNEISRWVCTKRRRNGLITKV